MYVFTRTWKSLSTGRLARCQHVAIRDAKDVHHGVQLLLFLSLPRNKTIDSQRRKRRRRRAMTIASRLKGFPKATTTTTTTTTNAKQVSRLRHGNRKKKGIIKNRLLLAGNCSTASNCSACVRERERVFNQLAKG